MKHAIAAWLPHNKLLYVSDIKVPHSPDVISDARLKEARYCWFANWAKSQLPEDYAVMDSHSHQRITGRYRAKDLLKRMAVMPDSLALPEANGVQRYSTRKYHSILSNFAVVSP